MSLSEKKRMFAALETLYKKSESIIERQFEDASVDHLVGSAKEFALSPYETVFSGLSEGDNGLTAIYVLCSHALLKMACRRAEAEILAEELGELS